MEPDVAAAAATAAKLASLLALVSTLLSFVVARRAISSSPDATDPRRYTATADPPPIATRTRTRAAGRMGGRSSMSFANCRRISAPAAARPPWR